MRMVRVREKVFRNISGISTPRKDKAVFFPTAMYFNSKSCKKLLRHFLLRH